MTFEQDVDETRVLFRVDAGGEVTAVFPDLQEEPYLWRCYAHIGQHGSCSRLWYYTTRPARPAEYEDLKSELESAPYGYRLKVIKRWSRRKR